MVKDKVSEKSHDEYNRNLLDGEVTLQFFNRYYISLWYALWKKTYLFYTCMCLGKILKCRHICGLLCSVLPIFCMKLLKRHVYFHHVICALHSCQQNGSIPGIFCVIKAIRTSCEEAVITAPTLQTVQFTHQCRAEFHWASVDEKPRAFCCIIWSGHTCSSTGQSDTFPNGVVFFPNVIGW